MVIHQGLLGNHDLHATAIELCATRLACVARIEVDPPAEHVAMAGERAVEIRRCNRYMIEGVVHRQVPRCYSEPG